MQKSFKNFTFTILRLNKLIQKIKLYEVGEYGLKAIHVMCIYELYVNREGLTLTEIVKRTLEDKGAISRALALLREKGYVTNGGKKYNALIKLTPEGEKVAVYINKKAEKAVIAAGISLSEEDKEIMYSSLWRIADNLKAYYDGISENDN